MGLRYCARCQNAFPTYKTVAYQGLYYCLKCRVPTEDMGSEEAVLSESAKGITVTYADLGTLTGKVETVSKPDIDAVILECEDTLAKDPKNVAALLTLAKRYFAKGDFKNARRYVIMALEVDPENGEAQQFLLSRLDSKANPGLIGNSTSAEDLFKLAQIYLGKEEVEKAKKILLKLVELNAQHPGSRRLLSEIYCVEENYDEALTQLGILKTLQPNNVYVDYNIGVVAFLGGHLDRAKASFKAAYEGSQDPELTKDIAEWQKRISA